MLRRKVEKRCSANEETARLNFKDYGTLRSPKMSSLSTILASICIFTRERRFNFQAHDASILRPTTIAMEQRSHFSSLSAMLFALFLSLLAPANALYFYMDSTVPKCFFEELPKDTLVVGMQLSTPPSFSIPVSSFPDHAQFSCLPNH